MAELHLVHVFIGPGGSGGNPLAVFVDGSTIPVERVGSEIAVRPGPDHTVEIGGRWALIEVREFAGQALE
jgi:hypothetical protein